MTALVVALAARALIPAAADADVVVWRSSGEALIVGDAGGAAVVARDVGSASLSADGATLAVATRRGGVFVIREGRRQPVRVRTAGGRRRPLRGIEHVLLAPVGDRLLVQRRDGWHTVDLGTGTVRPAVADWFARPRWSPDGRAIAWASDDGRVFLHPVDRRASARVVFDDDATDVAWLGGELAVLHGDVITQRVSAVDPITAQRRSLPIRAGSAIWFGPVHGTQLLTLVTIGESRDVERLKVVRADGGVVRTIRPTRGVLDWTAAFSEDASALFVIGGLDLWRIDLATGAERRVLRNASGVGEP